MDKVYEIAFVSYFSSDNKYCFCKTIDEPIKTISFNIPESWNDNILPPIKGELLELSDIRSKLNKKKKIVYFAINVKPFI